MARRSLDQERAAFAWLKVAAAKKSGDFKAYTNLAKGVPALIMSNGLMQTLAFLNQKSRESIELAGAIQEWLGITLKEDILSNDFVGVMEALQKGESAFYMQATEEALEILRWVRQFAPALGKD